MKFIKYNIVDGLSIVEEISRDIYLLNIFKNSKNNIKKGDVLSEVTLIECHSDLTIKGYLPVFVFLSDDFIKNTKKEVIENDFLIDGDDNIKSGFFIVKNKRRRVIISIMSPYAIIKKEEVNSIIFTSSLDVNLKNAKLER